MTDSIPFRYQDIVLSTHQDDAPLKIQGQNRLEDQKIINLEQVV